VSSFADHRVASFVHYWLYLMEVGQGDASGFRELLAENFSLDLGRGEPMKAWNSFAEWFQAIPT